MELTINGLIAELGDSMPSITKKSVDIENPSARFVDFTNRFVLPDTNQNRRIFGSPAKIGSDNRSYDKLYDCSLRDVFEIFRGKGFLDSGTIGKFNFQLVDKSKDLFNSLSVKLDSVSWDDKDTVLTQTAINALDVYDIDNCWFWGKACYHRQPKIQNTDQTTGDARCKYSRPAFNINSLLKRAIEAQGFGFTEPPINLAMSSNHKQFFFADYQKTFNSSYSPAGTLAITGFDTYDFKEADVTVTGSTVKGISKHNYHVRGFVTTSADIHLNISSTDETTTKNIYNHIALPRSGYLDYITSEIYDGPTGMTTSFTLVGAGEVSFNNVLIYKMVDENNEDLSTNPFLNHYIKFYDNIDKDLTYMDLIRLICVLTNSYPVVDNYNKVFSFASLANLNKMNSVDWSDKFVINSESVNSKYNGLFQKNYLRWENDITVNRDHGSDYFLTDNESLVAEGDYMVLSFGSSVDVIVNSNEIAQLEVYDDANRIQDREVKRRIFLIEDSRLIFNGLHWEQLKAAYYDEWFNSLYRVRSIPCEVNLNKLDVLKWHPKQLVYIDYFKTTFIVLEINNFISGRKTKVKLLAYGR
jgi:hypothetical protein